MESLLFPSAMSSNSSSLSTEEHNTLYSVAPSNTRSPSLLVHHDFDDFKDHNDAYINPLPPIGCKIKKKRSLPGNPDPDAEVIALSPKTLLATNRFVCEICNKGFQRDQNLQLHRRGHNLPWKLKKRSSGAKDQRKRVYVCPEPGCVHNHPSRALGDLTGIKKHYCRKHGEKKWKCEKCSKVYAVQSDWKAHSKTCGTREYRCDCGTLFSRKDSFITHRAFCDALAEESARLILANQQSQLAPNIPHLASLSPSNLFPFQPQNPSPNPNPNPNPNLSDYAFSLSHKTDTQNPSFPINFPSPPPPFSHHLSATELLQKAATLGPTSSTGPTESTFGHMARLAMSDMDIPMKVSPDYCLGFGPGNNNISDLMKKPSDGEITRDFLGLRGDDQRRVNSNHGADMAMKPVQNFGLIGDHATFTNIATASPRMWG